MSRLQDKVAIVTGAGRLGNTCRSRRVTVC